MKKELILVIILCVSIFLDLNIVLALNGTITSRTITGEAITGDAVTGKATASISVNVTLIGRPTLTIEKPQNNTYSSNNSIPIRLSSNSDDLWYHVDGESNRTISPDNVEYRNFIYGTHKLYAYANNSAGITAKNLTFYIQSPSSFFFINYSNFSGAFAGNSTNFNEYSYEELQNLSNVIFEKVSRGKIRFLQPINITEHAVGNELNLDAYINFSFNRIELNSTFLQNFNKNATLELHGLSFANPRILINGEVCSSTACKQNYYTNGNLSFNVTGFSAYSAEETSSDSSPGGSSGSSSGGSSSAADYSAKGFKIFQDSLSVSLKQGEAKKVQFSIENERKEKMDFNIDSTLSEFILIRENKFSLNARERKTITLEFLSFTNTKPGLYLGKIFISAGGIKKEILASLEIESVGALFDVKVEIPSRFFKITAGEELFAQIKIFNVVKSGLVDVVVDYEIRDSKDNTIAFEQETVAVEMQTEYIKKFLLPEDIKNGDYILYVKTTAKGESASGIARFSVVDKEYFDNIQFIYFIITAVILVLLFYILYILRSVHRIKGLKVKNTISEKNLMKYKLIRRGGGGLAEKIKFFFSQFFRKI